MSQEIKDRFKQFVAPTYGRFPITLDRGEGAYVWDTDGKRYLDLGGGIAVNCLGHAHPEISQVLAEQSSRLMHCTNFYHFDGQAKLAENLAKRLGQGRVFFCNSGAESSEVMIKLSRRFGQAEGRFEVITAENSFHGRTMAGISATGQAKVKDGFAPLLPGFSHVPFNDLDAVRAAITPATVAMMIEGVQGESGIRPASAEYLLGLRELCNEKNLLLLWGTFAPDRFRVFRPFSVINSVTFCRTPWAWPSRLAAASRWAPFGFPKSTPTYLAREHTAQPSAATHLPVPWRTRFSRSSTAMHSRKMPSRWAVSSLKD